MCVCVCVCVFVETSFCRERETARETARETFKVCEEQRAVLGYILFCWYTVLSSPVCSDLKDVTCVCVCVCVC